MIMSYFYTCTPKYSLEGNRFVEISNYTSTKIVFVYKDCKYGNKAKIYGLMARPMKVLDK